MSPQTLEIDVNGEASFMLPAERAILNIRVRDESKNKDKTTAAVIAASRKVEAILCEHSGKTKDSSQQAPIDYWSRDSLYEHNNRRCPTEREPNPPHEYKARVNFSLHLQQFNKLGPLIHELVAIKHVQSQGVEWALTSATQNAQRSQLRTEAAQHANKKAQEYATALGFSKVKAFELHETSSYVRSANRKTAAYHKGDEQSQTRNMAGEQDWEDVSEEAFQYMPEDVTMTQAVSVKFTAE